MVLLGVREHDQVEPRTPRARSFEATSASGGPPSTSAAAPPGAWQQRRVALPDVEEGDA